ncbi:CENPI protein, partial [Oxylabes madagascariensis]|nr:CENPI protein [Oxylabes madagascariensis]
FQTYFKSSEGPWKAAIAAVRQRNQGTSPVSQAKWNSQLVIPASSANTNNLREVGETNCVYLYSTDMYFPVEQLQTFPQLLQNIHRLEFPSQMGSVLTNPLLLHYMNCYSILSCSECTWCVVDNPNEEEFKSFLETVYKAECFLQEGFAACEEFLYKTLPLWDGFCCRSEILRLMSWIPPSSSSDIKSYLYDPLAQLFFTSSIYFK